MAEIVPGSVIASAWRIERLLGRGGMGKVFLATGLKDGRPAAVKVLEPFHAADDDALTRFKREGEITRGLAHRGVVQVLDSGFDLGHWFLVMELLEGENADQRLSHSGPLSPERCVALVLPVLDVLERAHSQGVLHRDLKPANVFLSAGPPPTVKVLDFGVSRAGGGATRITRAGVMMGTLCYMAPEQMMDTASSSERSDLYSVGAMIFELIAGVRAFPGRNDGALIERILARAAPLLAEVVPSVPPALSSLVERLLRKSPAERPASANEVAAALRAILTPDTHGLFEGFEGAPRRSAVVVADPDGGLSETFVRPSPQPPPKPKPVTIVPPLPAPVPVTTTEVVRSVDAPKRSSALIWSLTGAGLVALLLAAGAFVLPALDPPAPIHLDTTPVRGMPPPPPPEARGAPKKLVLAEGSKVVPLDTSESHPICYQLTRDAETLGSSNVLLAKGWLNHCLRFDPMNAPALYLWGQLLTDRALVGGRVRHLQLFLKYAAYDHPLPESVEAELKALHPPADDGRGEGYVQLAHGAMVMGSWAKAQQVFTNCLSVAPNHAACHFGWAITADRLSQWSSNREIVFHYLRALDLQPDGPDAVRARLYLDLHLTLAGNIVHYTASPVIPWESQREP